MRRVECKLCGKVFETEHHNKKYCSEECSKEAYRIKQEGYNKMARMKRAERREAGKTFRKRKCIICGEEYMPNSAPQKYCSNCTGHGKDIINERYKAKRAARARAKKNGNKVRSFDETCKMLATKGMSYAEYQKQKTWEMLNAK